MSRILVAGGSGFIGAALVDKLLSDGHSVSVLGRDAGRIQLRFGNRVRAIVWGCADSPGFLSEVSAHEVVYNLVGESTVPGPHTAGKTQRIRDSRVKTTRVLVEALNRAVEPPRLLISASAVAYYGEIAGAQTVDETGAKGMGFLAELCHEWEDAAHRAEMQGVRVVVTRFGVVLGGGGGAFEAMSRPFRLGLGGPIGNGRQGFSFVSLTDCIRALEFCRMEPGLRGPVNVTAPAPTDGRGVARAMARVLGRPNWLPVPKFVLHTLYGKGADALNAGQRVLPRVLLERGFQFQHPTIDAAIAAAGIYGNAR